MSVEQSGDTVCASVALTTSSAAALCLVCRLEEPFSACMDSWAVPFDVGEAYFSNTLSLRGPLLFPSKENFVIRPECRTATNAGGRTPDRSNNSVAEKLGVSPYGTAAE